MMKFKHFSPPSRLPLILQNEISECGLACLAMIFNYYQAKVDLPSLRESHNISIKGMALSNLIAIAKKFSFQTKAIKIECSQLPSLNLPCILHWDMNHFVVLAKIDKKKALIYDPAFGKRYIKLEKLSKHFTGIALELIPDENFQPMEKQKKLSLQTLIGSIKNLKKIISLIVGFAIALQILIIISPQYIQRVVDSIHQIHTVKHLIFLALLFAGLKVIEIGIGVIRNYGINYLGTLINLKIGTKIFRHLLKLPMNYYEKRQSGDIISRFSSVDKIRSVITEGLVEGIVDGIMSIATFLVMFFYSHLMSCIVISSVAIYCIIRNVRFHNIRMFNDRLIKANAIQNTFLIETIRGMQPIKIFSKEKFRRKGWQAHYINFLNATNETANQQVFFNACKNVLFNCEMILIILIGAIGILEKSFTLGMLYAFIFYRTQFVNAAGSFIDKLLEYKMLSLHLERLSDIVLEETERKKNNYKNTIADIKTIEIRNLYYKYGEFEDYVLNNISFTVKAKETIAITAPSGFGKTTLLKIMMGLLYPSQGEILINDIPLSKIQAQSYRNLITSVMQEDTLFAGSIYENIAFFSPNINQEKVIECAKIAAIHEEIMNLPMNYHTFIGDMGTVLSGGQKQRVLLARALYSNPQVIFLDESTSHLDVKKEQEINDALKKINITKIIIAHRSETINTADKVIDLSKI